MAAIGITAERPVAIDEEPAATENAAGERMLPGGDLFKERRVPPPLLLSYVRARRLVRAVFTRDPPGVRPGDLALTDVPPRRAALLAALISAQLGAARTPPRGREPATQTPAPTVRLSGTVKQGETAARRCGRIQGILLCCPREILGRSVGRRVSRSTGEKPRSYALSRREAERSLS